MPSRKPAPKRPRGRPVTTGPTQPLPVRLPADLRALIDAEAERQARSASSLIVWAMREWLAGRGKSRP